MANGNGNGDGTELTPEEHEERRKLLLERIELRKEEWRVVKETADLDRTEHERKVAAMALEAENMQERLTERQRMIRDLERLVLANQDLDEQQLENLKTWKLEVKALKLKTKLHGRAAAETKKHGDALEELNAEGAEFSHNLLGVNSKLGDFTKKLFETKGGFKAFMKGVVSALNPLKLLAKLLTTIFESSVMLHGQLDSARMSFMAATGASKAFGDEVFENAKALKGTGIRMAEYEQSFRALYRGAVDFTKQSPAVRRELAEMTAYLRELGVAEGDVAEITNEATRSLGFGFTEVKGVLEEVAGVANSLKMPFDVVMKDFANVSKKLAFYGKNVIGVFAKLEQQAKATGLSIDQLLGFVTQFDTFEGAGKAVGKLNAIMGGPYLNSIDMLNATEEERIEILQRSMKQAGMNFKQMGKYEQQMIAQSLGVEVAEARKLFGAETEEDKIQAMEEDEIKRRQNSMLTLTERLLNIMEQFASDKFIEWMESLHSVLKSIQGLVKKFMGFFDKHTKPALAVSAAALIGGPAAMRGLRSQLALRTRMGQRATEAARGAGSVRWRNLLRGKSPWSAGKASRDSINAARSARGASAIARSGTGGSYERLAQMRARNVTPGQKPGIIRRVLRIFNPLRWKSMFKGAFKWFTSGKWKQIFQKPEWISKIFQKPEWISKMFPLKRPPWLNWKALKLKIGNFLGPLRDVFKRGGGGKGLALKSFAGIKGFLKRFAPVAFFLAIFEGLIGWIKDLSVVFESSLTPLQKIGAIFSTLGMRIIEVCRLFVGSFVDFIDMIVGAFDWLSIKISKIPGMGWLRDEGAQANWGRLGKWTGMGTEQVRDEHGMMTEQMAPHLASLGVGEGALSKFGTRQKAYGKIGGGSGGAFDPGEDLLSPANMEALAREQGRLKVDDFIYRGKGELGPGTITPINSEDELFGAKAGGSIEAALAKTLTGVLATTLRGKGAEGTAAAGKQPVEIKLYLSENGPLLQKFVVDAMDSDYAKKKWGPLARR